MPLFKRSKPSGFSLLEALATLALLGLLLATTLSSLRPAVQAGGSYGLAQSLAERIRGLQISAMARQQTLALAFPSQSGRLPCSTSCYTLEGYAVSKVGSTQRFSSDFPGTSLFCGSWSGSQPRTLATPDPYPSPPLSWLKVASDYHLFFTPDGRIASQDLPLFKGAYHLVALTGASYSATSAPAGTPLYAGSVSYYSLTGAAQPVTLEIRQDGLVRVVEGLVDADSSVQSLQAGFAAAAQGSPPRNSSNAPPVVEQPTLYPDPSLIPAGSPADLYVDVNGHANLELAASDSDGDALFCSWQSVPTGGGATGSFSTSDQTPMRWDPVARKWRGTYAWHPPDGAADLSQFQLIYTVTDERGDSVTASGNAIVTVEVHRLGKIIMDTGVATIVCFGDGTCPTALPLAPDVRAPVFSADGSKFLFQRSNGEIWLASADGTQEWRVHNETNGPVTFADLSPDCSQVVFTVMTGGDPYQGDLKVVNADGTGLHTLATGNTYAPRFSPDGNQISFTHRDPSGNVNLGVCARDGTGRHTVTAYSGGSVLPRHVHWSPDGQHLVFISETGMGVVEPSLGASSARMLGLNADNPAFSPGGGQIIFDDGTPQHVLIGNFDGTALSGIHRLFPSSTFGYEARAHWVK